MANIELASTSQAAVVAKLANDGLIVRKDSTVSQLCDAVKRLTGKSFNNTPETRWAYLREYVNGPQTRTVFLPPFKELKPGRYKHVKEEIERRELNNSLMFKDDQSKFGDGAI